MPMTEQNKASLVITQDLLWSDMDAFAHINNKVFFRYFEDVRIEYFRRIGMLEYMQEHHKGPILARTECDFIQPLHFPDSISIGAKATILSEKKFAMEYTVCSRTRDCTAAKGSGLIVFYDYKQKKTCPIPESLAAKIEEMG